MTKKKMKTRTLVLAALFVGINIILSRLGALMLFNNTVRLSFGNVPLILSGIVLGPVPGFLTGITSDILGFLINSHGGAFHPGFMISAGLTGALPGIIKILFKNQVNLSVVIVSNIVIYIFISGLLNTLWLTHLMGTGFFVLLPARLISSVPITTVNIILIHAVIKSLSKTKFI
jgi:ECF transporter S component (folate family)